MAQLVQEGESTRAWLSPERDYREPLHSAKLARTRQGYEHCEDQEAKYGTAYSRTDMTVSEILNLSCSLRLQNEE
ncbi:C6 zinc finger domain protein [Aspergillus luchuensis]|uniref:C6 zinc finger domain protein n=1 Tax=Aspergillus kawachii TaxID=1069201 RepID=A0A146FT18_ASPKA|nr:C6 zinc finger domain protein [Aspergillus luchuensis]